MNNTNSNNHFSKGFMLGAILGGAAVFLLGTKRGRKILKTISEEGLEGLSAFIEDQGFLTVDEEGVKTESRKNEKTESSHANGIKEEIEKDLTQEIEESQSPKPKSSKRFFIRKN